jgi:subtilisin family serine protease
MAITLRSLGARIVRRNTAIGVATVVADSNFRAKAMRSGAFMGVALDRVIGRAPREINKSAISRPFAPRSGGRVAKVANHLGEDPLFRYQWQLRQIDAGPSDSYELQEGDPRVVVGIIDTGIQANHIDVGNNLDEDLSRNFTTDIPSVDGKCKAEPDNSCHDSALVDEGGHGTWTATTVAGARNKAGVSGVAPGVTLVNLRAGQDSGYFFLQPSVDALTYAADNGVDVVNMSFFVDPWLYNCVDNPADSPEAQEEQRTIIEAMQRAIDYAHDHDVTMFSAMGNEWTDLGNPTVDEISPDFPVDAPYRREIDNSCLSMPTEAENVIAVSGTGPSGRKSWLSNYGLEQTDVAAPSGDSFDDWLPFPTNMALSAWTKSSLEDFGLLTKKGKPNSPDVLRRCSRNRKPHCSYWLFGEGTSIASPLAAGVAALIVSEFGKSDDDGGLTMDPADVQTILEASAHQHDCPEGGVQRYPEMKDALQGSGLTVDDFEATCEEGASGVNGFYGHGIVNAVDALAARP